MFRLFLLFTTLALGACSFFGNNEIDLSAPADLQEFEEKFVVEKSWSVDLGKGSGKAHTLLSPVIEKDVIYAADRGGLVAAFELDGGDSLWKTKSEDDITGAVGVGPNLVLYGTQKGALQTLDKTTGELGWRVMLPSEILAAPVSNGDVVVAVTLDGGIHGLDASDGSPRWLVNVKLPLLTVRGNAKPIIIDDLVYVGLDNGKVAAYRVDDGASLWEIRVGVPEGKNDLERMVDVDAEPLYHAGNLYAGSYQAGVMGINPKAGRGLWFQEGSVYNRLGAHGGTLAAVQTNSVVKAYNPSDGTLLWETEELKNRGLNGPAVNRDFIAVADSKGYLHLLARRTGEVVGRKKIGGGIRLPTLIDDDRIILISRSGKLMVYSFSNS